MFAGTVAWASEELQHLDIILKPVSRDGKVTEAKRIEAPALPAMSMLVRMPLRITSILTPTL